MKPLHYVLLWIGEALLYTLVLAALFLLIPEMKAYSLVRIFTDVIPVIHGINIISFPSAFYHYSS